MTPLTSVNARFFRVRALDDIGKRFRLRLWRPGFRRAHASSRPAGGATSLNWKRAGKLLPVPALLYWLIPILVPDGQLGNATLRMLIANLMSPQALFDQRSPGTRLVGNLITIKGKGKPHERVLSTVRERPTPRVVLDMPVVVDIAPGALLAFPDANPSLMTLPQYPIAGGAPFVPSTPFVSSPPQGLQIPPGPLLPPLVGFIPGGIPSPPSSTPVTPAVPVASNPPGNNTPPGGTPDTPPGGTPGTPPGGTPGTPPGGTPGTPPGGGVIVLPEPASWTMMLLGLVGIGGFSRRRKPQTGKNGAR